MIKRILVSLSLLFLITMQSGAQDWNWNQDSLSWKISTHMNFSIMRTKLYTTVGSETINDTIYRVVHTINCFAPPVTENEFFCLIRQEGDSILLRYDDREYLMYDFGLEVGDTFDRYLCFSEGAIGPGNLGTDTPLATSTVTDVDTIEIISDSRRRIFLEDDIWIEGIGSVYSFAKMDYCITDVSDNLECFHRNAEQEYTGSWDTCCPTNLSTEFHNLIPRDVILFPNPVFQDQSLNLSKDFSKSILFFYNSNGKLVNTVNWQAGISPKSIGLHSGFYTVLIQNENVKYRQKLIVK